MSTILYNMLASPQQSRKSDLKHPDRVIAAPFQNAAHVQHKPHNFVKSESFRHVDFRSHSFLPLDPPSLVKLERYCGPTTESNWVIPGVLLVGAYPASEDDTETFDLITGILKLGIRKFACLQLEYRDDVPPEQWRAGKGLRPYFQDVKHIVQNKTIYFPNCSEPIVDIQNLSFDHLPIVDCGVTDDDRVLQLCRKLVLDITKGEVIYLHCWGGHGRTGTVVSIMLHLMYGMSATEAMARCQLVHDLRICPVNVGSPQTQTQRDQVIRIVSELQRQYRTEKILYENSSDSLNSTVRVSRSGSSDYDEDRMNKNNQRGGGVNGGGSFTEGMKLSRNIHSFNFNSNGSGSITPVGSPMPKTNSNKNMTPKAPAASASSSFATSSSAAPAPFFSSVVVQDSVQERLPSAGSSVKPLPAVSSAKSSSSNGINPITGSLNSATDFHKTIPRPDSSLSPQKRGHSVHSLKEAEREMSDLGPPLDYSALSPASTFHRKAYEMESRSPSEQLDGLNGSALKALSMRTPSSEDSTSQQLPGVAVDNFTRNSLTPVNLEDLLLPDPTYERHTSTSSLPQGERQLSTASQPMSISSEVSGHDYRPPSAASSGGHSEGTIKRNISCTLANADVVGDLNDDNLSTQVRKASATTLNNHNFQQKEPVSQPSAGSSFSISQVLNVARQVLLNGGKTSPTSASSHSSSSSAVPSAPSAAGSSSPRGSVKTPTPPTGVAPSSRSSRNSRS